MKSSIFVILIWIIAFIFAKFTDWSLFEAFVITTLGYLFVRTFEGDTK